MWRSIPADSCARPREGVLLDRVADNAALIRAISGLAADQRDVIVAIDIVGLSYKEAAKALGTHESTVMST